MYRSMEVVNGNNHSKLYTSLGLIQDFIAVPREQLQRKRAFNNQIIIFIRITAMPTLEIETICDLPVKSYIVYNHGWISKLINYLEHAILLIII